MAESYFPWKRLKIAKWFNTIQKLQLMQDYTNIYSDKWSIQKKVFVIYVIF